MYGFNDPRLLSWMVGREVEQIGLGQHELVFHFHPEGSMMVAGEWQLLDAEGRVVDQRQEHAARGEYRVHRLIGPAVTDVDVPRPESMTIAFANGYKLRLIDDDPRFEAVVMEPGTGHPTIVV